MSFYQRCSYCLRYISVGIRKIFYYAIVTIMKHRMPLWVILCCPDWIVRILLGRLVVKNWTIAWSFILLCPHFNAAMFSPVHRENITTCGDNYYMYIYFSLVGEGTTVFTNLSQYMKSLQVIKNMKPKVIYPGHGK